MQTAQNVVKINLRVTPVTELITRIAQTAQVMKTKTVAKLIGTTYHAVNIMIAVVSDAHLECGTTRLLRVCVNHTATKWNARISRSRVRIAMVVLKVMSALLPRMPNTLIIPVASLLRQIELRLAFIAHCAMQRINLLKLIVRTSMTHSVGNVMSAKMEKPTK